MKQTFKIAFLWLLTLLILLFILFVDTTFYHVPSFIKMFRIEREVLVGISIILIFYHINYFFRRHTLRLKPMLIVFSSVIVGLFIFSLLPQIILKKYLILWDENPFLAEYPLVWNSVSLFCNIVAITGLLIILLLVKRLLEFRPNRFSDFEFRFLLLLTIVSAIAFNIIEDRYTFARMSILQQEANAGLWILGFFIILISLVISFYKSWIDVLDKREKYIGFFVSLLMIPVSLYLFFSSILFPVYAFSTTVKGFVLAMLLFMNVYVITSFVGLLFRLPTASIYDRVTGEISAIARVSRMISENTSLDTVFQTIVEDACGLTDSDACWLTLEGSDSANIKASIHLSPEDQEALRQTGVKCLRDIIQKNQGPLIIYNIQEDERTLPLQMMDVSWKSMIVVPMIQDGRIVGILYSVKKSSYAYDEKDLATLNSFAIQTTIAMSASPKIQKLKPVDDEADRMVKIKEYGLEDLSVFCACSEKMIIDQISISKNNYLLYRIACSAANPEIQTELKGVFKTLFALEADYNRAFQQAYDLINSEYSGRNLSVFQYFPSSKSVSLRASEKLISLATDLKSGEINYRPMEKSSGNYQHYTFDFQIGHDGKIIIGNKTIIQDLLGDNIEDSIGLADNDLMKKIIPETRSGSGNLFLISLKKAYLAKRSDFNQKSVS